MASGNPAVQPDAGAMWLPTHRPGSLVDGVAAPAQGLARDLPVPPQAAAWAESTGIARSPLHVLLVDAAPRGPGQVEQELAGLPVSLVRVAGDTQALQRMATQLPDLILIDLDEAGGAGLQLLQRLTALDPGVAVPVVVLSRQRDPAVPAMALQLGAADCVRKPFVGRELQARCLASLRTQSRLRVLRAQATRDKLTGLYNREALHEQLRRLLARRAGGAGAVLFYLDFDDFKRVNDAYGHEAGDQLLASLADKLSAPFAADGALAAYGASSHIARLGGDEFVVLLRECAPGQIGAVAGHIQQAVSADCEVQGQRIATAASMGIVQVAPRHATAGQVLSDADAAMYEAKAAGRNRYLLFDASMRERLQQRARTERELRLALQRCQLVLHYQPIVSLRTGGLAGFEALVRWNHPTRGLVGPAEFLPTAVASGLVVPLGRWVLEQACRDAVQLRAAMGDAAPSYVSVNVSRKQLADAQLPQQVAVALASAGLEPARLHIEITESELIGDRWNARQVVEELKALGVVLVVDDFGTGYSSLASLHEFPIDVLKLDRSFIANCLHGERGHHLLAVAHAMVQLAGNIGLKVVAEGVESRAQLALLQSLGCELAQGFLLGRPVPLAEATGYRVPGPF